MCICLHEKRDGINDKPLAKNNENETSVSITNFYTSTEETSMAPPQRRKGGKSAKMAKSIPRQVGYENIVDNM